MREGGRLVADRKDADAVVEIRAGALSTDSSDLLIGIPSLQLPVPMAGAAKTPELAFVKKNQDEGVAKIGITAYDAKTGVPEPFTLSEPIYGFSNRTRWVVLSLVGWTNTDLMKPPGD